MRVNDAYVFQTKSFKSEISQKIYLRFVGNRLPKSFQGILDDNIWQQCNISNNFNSNDYKIIDID